MTSQIGTQQGAANRDVERRPYTSPRLVVHGDVRQLTADTQSASNSSINGGSAADL